MFCQNSQIFFQMGRPKGNNEGKYFLKYSWLFNSFFRAIKEKNISEIKSSTKYCYLRKLKETGQVPYKVGKMITQQNIWLFVPKSSHWVP